jgi:hypothetical protein
MQNKRVVAVEGTKESGMVASNKRYLQHSTTGSSFDFWSFLRGFHPAGIGVAHLNHQKM